MLCVITKAMVIQMSTIRCYSDLISIPTFEDRYRYLRLGGSVGATTFGCDRWLNQRFYQDDEEWLELRDFVIIRDCGRDLAMPGREIPNGVPVHVHHMNPITKEDILRRTKFLLDPEYVVCTMDNTHKAIHYGNEDILFSLPVERRQNDTCPWRR